jgi:hypothetical protein
VPYGWVNPDGTLDGSDSAGIAAVDELLPQYTFKIELCEMAANFFENNQNGLTG